MSCSLLETGTRNICYQTARRNIRNWYRFSGTSYQLRHQFLVRVSWALCTFSNQLTEFCCWHRYLEINSQNWVNNVNQCSHLCTLFHSWNSGATRGSENKLACTSVDKNLYRTNSWRRQIEPSTHSVAQFIIIIQVKYVNHLETGKLTTCHTVNH